jgi:hypothetical protein
MGRVGWKNRFFPAVHVMAYKRRTFRIELGVQYLCSQRQASSNQWKANGYRANAPLLRERFDALLAILHGRGFYCMAVARGRDPRARCWD